MTPKDNSLMARCPECDSRIYFERPPDLGETIVCPECETSLEVISSRPVRLDWAEEEVSAPFGGGYEPEETYDDYDSEDVFDEDDAEEWN